MRPLLLVALGSALGGVARFGCTLLAERLLGVAFPYGTLFVNVVGSFVIGFVFAATTEPGGRFAAGAEVRLFAMTGICGGYTTFSSFSLQTLTLLRTGHALGASANVVLSVTLCLAATWLGQLAGTAVLGPGRGGN